jgi:hypothetical protein
MSMSSNSFDVELANVRAKTLISVLLAIGAALQTLCGALLLHSGLNPEGVPIVKIMGAPVSTSTLGAIALCTAALWAYIAYLGRPHTAPAAEQPARPAAHRHDGTIEINDFSIAVPASDARPVGAGPSA